MARRRQHDLSNLRDKRSADKAKKDQERYEELGGDITEEIDALLDKHFPYDQKNDEPDFDGFDWDSAERLLRMLKQFRRTNGADASTEPARPPRRERQQVRILDPVPPVEIPDPPADSESTTTPKRKVRDFGRKVWGNS